MDNKSNLQNRYEITQLEPLKIKPIKRLKPARKFNFPGGKLLAIIFTFNDRIYDRRAFANMSDEQIQDLGLSREILRHEIAKPFWRE